MTVGRLLDEISSAEFTYWIARFNRQPFGDDVESWRTGTIAAVVANAHSKRGRYKAQDFMPKIQGRPRSQTPEEMSRILACWAARSSKHRLSE